MGRARADPEPSNLSSRWSTNPKPRPLKKVQAWALMGLHFLLHIKFQFSRPKIRAWTLLLSSLSHKKNRSRARPGLWPITSLHFGIASPYFSLSSASHLSHLMRRFNPMISSSLKGWFFYLCVIYVCLTNFRSPFLSPSVIPIRVRSQMHFNLASTKWIADEVVTFWLHKQCNIYHRESRVDSDMKFFFLELVIFWKTFLKAKHEFREVVLLKIRKRSFC